MESMCLQQEMDSFPTALSSDRGLKPCQRTGYEEIPDLVDEADNGNGDNKNDDDDFPTFEQILAQTWPAQPFMEKVQIDLTCNSDDDDFPAYEQIPAQTEPAQPLINESEIDLTGDNDEDDGEFACSASTPPLQVLLTSTQKELTPPGRKPTSMPPTVAAPGEERSPFKNPPPWSFLYHRRHRGLTSALPDAAVDAHRTDTNNLGSVGKPTKKLKVTHRQVSPSLLPPKKQCPVCQTEIDQQLFELYCTNGRRERLATQFALCKAHKWKTAQAEWTRLGYPIIDWESFPKRLSDFDEIIHKTINEGISRYRDEFDRSIGIRNIRHRLEEQIESPQRAGYYGPRGFDVMTDHILSTFMVHLRISRQTDEISDYISLIVVPELTVSLIMDDMKVDDTEARRIWVQSAAIGDILNDICEIEE